MSSWSANTEQVLKGLNVTSKKKALNSETGSKTIQEVWIGGRKYGPGEELGSIAAKVLAPPPPPDISGIHGSLIDIDSDDDDHDIKNHSKKPRLKWRKDASKIDACNQLCCSPNSRKFDEKYQANNVN